MIPDFECVTISKKSEAWTRGYHMIEWRQRPFLALYNFTLEDCWATPLYPSEKLRVFLTLSPLAKSLPGGDIQQRQIELNWHNQAVSQQNDWLGLYEHDPTNNPTLPLRRIDVLGRNTGYHKTDILFGFPTIDRQLSAGDVCLGYWIGYIRNGVTIASNCLKIRPNWMWQNRFEYHLVSIRCIINFYSHLI